MIPPQAVEAAANVLDPQTMASGGALAEKFKEQTRAEARRILEAAAPHMLAAAWQRGRNAGQMDPYDRYPATNPYRSEP